MVRRRADAPRRGGADRPEMAGPDRTSRQHRRAAGCPPRQRANSAEPRTDKSCTGKPRANNSLAESPRAIAIRHDQQSRRRINRSSNRTLIPRPAHKPNAAKYTAANPEPADGCPAKHSAK
jgi:hypothetical protein